MRVVFVHGACVQDGAWWWHPTGELLAERGVGSDAPALPSCGETGEPVDARGPGLADDVAAVRSVLTASAEPTMMLDIQKFLDVIVTLLLSLIVMIRTVLLGWVGAGYAGLFGVRCARARL